MTGKLGPDAAAAFLGATGAADPGVALGPAHGEDAAAIDLGDRTLVVATDPLSLAADAVGRLAVHVACNDVAASGADPRWLTNTVLLPSADPEVMATIADQVDAAASDLGVAVVGGHTETVPALERPLLSMTALGTTARFLPTGGASPGDRLLLTKGAGIEATAILATDFHEQCAAAGVPDRTLDAAAGFLDDVSVVPDAAAVRTHATAAHDPTEGGVVTGLVELAVASDTVVTVDSDRVPVRPETRACCDALGVDPLRTFGSGALLAAVPPERVDDACEALATAGVDAAPIGRVREPTVTEPVGGSGSNTNVESAASTGGTLILDGEPIREPPHDELYRFWE